MNNSKAVKVPKQEGKMTKQISVLYIEFTCSKSFNEIMYLSVSKLHIFEKLLNALLRTRSVFIVFF